MNMRRRRFLQAAGLGAGSVLLPSLLWKRGVKAGPTPVAPPRVVFCFAEHGVVHERWGMRRGMPDDQRWTYDFAPLAEADFSPSLQPFYALRDQLTVIDGLSIAVGMADPYGDGHAKGWNCALTGGIARETIESVKSMAAKPSLDQVLGKALREQDPLLTDLVTQEYGIYQYNYHALLYAEPSPGAPVVRLPHLEQPQEAFERMFPNGDGTAPPDPIKVAQPDVLASVANMYDRIQGRLSSEDRRKLEQHRDLVRDMESRLRRIAGLSCGTPPTIQDYYWGEVSHSQRWRDHMDSFWRLATVALSCGMSRVITMQWGHPVVEDLGGTAELHEAYAHRSDPSQSGDPNYELAKTVMTNYSRYFYTAVANLATMMNDIQEDNGTLLDNTMIVILSDISHGGHAHDRWPVVILGGKNLLNTGRYYNMEKNTPSTSPYAGNNSKIGFPHNHVLVAIAQAMGTDLNVVGDATVQPKNTSLPAIDLSGPLPGLLR